MNPVDSGWLRAYMIYRSRRWKNHEPPVAVEVLKQYASPYQYLYYLLQPTGLMYGYPVRFIEDPHPQIEEWSEKDKLKVLLAEAFIDLGLYYYQREEESLYQYMKRIVADVLEFYKEHYKLYSKYPLKTLKKKGNPIKQLEYVMDKRINNDYDWRNIWATFFHNSLLFFDLIYFVKWKEGENIFAEEGPSKLRIDTRANILRVIAAAAHSDQLITPFESELFYFFLHSASLPAPQKRQAEAAFKKGIELNDIDLSGFTSWILKKYHLELAILTTYVKQKVSPEEYAFLQHFSDKLGLGEEELHLSMSNIENFVKESWEEVHYLQIKQNYRFVSEQFIRRMRILVRKNQRMIREEIEESRELVHLLRQSRQRELTPYEWEKIRQQLLDILRSIPAFAIFMMPLGSITLPILLRIVPKSMLIPSSFRENQTRYPSEDSE
ncbi:MAG: LETM1 domain-containing protein [Bacteroidota bacterium]